MSPRVWFGVVLAVVTAFALGAELSQADAGPRPPRVHYIDCSHGHHLWVSESGDLYGVPAGSDCPE